MNATWLPVKPFDVDLNRCSPVVYPHRLVVCLENDGEVAVSPMYTAFCATTVRHLGPSTVTPGEQRNQDSLYLKLSGHPDINIR